MRVSNSSGVNLHEPARRAAVRICRSVSNSIGVNLHPFTSAVVVVIGCFKLHRSKFTLFVGFDKPVFDNRFKLHRSKFTRLPREKDEE